MAEIEMKSSNEQAPTLAENATPPPFFERDFTIRGVSLNRKDVEKLCDLLEQKTAEARKLEVQYVLDSPIDPENPPEEEKLQEEAERVFRISHALRDASGRLGIKGVDRPDMSKGYVSDEVESLWLSNREWFEINVRARPKNWVDIYIDFRRPSLAWNFENIPSNPTPNGSCLNVKGQDEQWVISTHQRLIEFFDQRKIKWGWLHASGVYDIFLYFLVVPFVLWRAYLFEMNPPQWVGADSNVTVAGFYIYAFLIALLLARQVFLFARWVFPAVEFVSKNSWTPFCYRTVFFSVVLGLFVWVLQMVITAIF